jgi:hypothetical protein
VNFSKVLNFSTSAACPENVYVHGNYNPIFENNVNDKFAVKLVRNDGNKEQCVGHVPIEHSKVFKFFLKKGTFFKTFSRVCFLSYLHEIKTIKSRIFYSFLASNLRILFTSFNLQVFMKNVLKKVCFYMNI